MIFPFDDMKFSVIVPVYNAAPTLRRCVESVLGQTFADFELILVDDGSRDESGRICDEYASADGRVRVIHKPNGGVSSARNAGIEAARGEYLVFVDSDDYVEADYLEQFSSLEADCGICGYRRFDDKGKGEWDSPASGSYSKREEMMRFVDSHFPHCYMRTPWSKAIRREVITGNGIRFDENTGLGEDALFALECYNRCKTLQTLDYDGYNYYAPGWDGSKYVISARVYKDFVNNVQEVLAGYEKPDELPGAFPFLNLVHFGFFSASLMNLPFGKSVYESLQFLRLGLLKYVPRETRMGRLWSGIGVMTLPYQKLIRRFR